MRVGLIAAAAAAALAASVAVGAAGAAPVPIRVGLVLKGLENPFFVAMFEGAREAGARLGARLSVRVARSGGDAAGQAAHARLLIGGGHACYVVNPVDGKNLIAPLRGVTRPIVNVDSPVDAVAARRAGVSIRTHIGTDNVAAGALAARAMLALLPRGGDVVLVGGYPHDTSSLERLAGFSRGARGTRLRVVARVFADYDRTEAQLAAARILRNRPGIDGVFAVNDLMALGVADGVGASRGSRKIKIVGVDGIPDALDAVRTGAISATVAQYPYTMGQMAVEACVAAVRGLPLPAQVAAPVGLVTSANVAQASKSFPRPPRAYPDPIARLLGHR